MQDIEPYFFWRDYYKAEDDEYSPFYGKEYSEFDYQDTIYNHYIHPQWDSIESESLFVKLLFANYDVGYAIIELFGEWNDALHNDIMLLKQNLLEFLINEGINKIILIGRNVLNFHFGDDEYYMELGEELEEGWLMGIQFPEHVIREQQENGIGYYLQYLPLDAPLNFEWATKKPNLLFEMIEQYMEMRLD